MVISHIGHSPIAFLVNLLVTLINYFVLLEIQWNTVKLKF